MFRNGWPEVPHQWLQEGLSNDFKVLRKLKVLCTKCLAQPSSHETIRSPLEAWLHITTPSTELKELMEDTFKDSRGGCGLKEFLNVSKVCVNAETPPTSFDYTTSGCVRVGGVEVNVGVSTGKFPEGVWSKCPRCWQYYELVSDDGLCNRCHQVESINNTVIEKL